jgi:hypothetical protein
MSKAAELCINTTCKAVRRLMCRFHCHSWRSLMARKMKVHAQVAAAAAQTHMGTARHH